METVMVKAVELVEAVKRVLVFDWDPIGVRDVPQAQDEYDVYAKAIAQLLAARVSVSDLSKHLLDIQTDAMGLAGTPERNTAVALKLCGLVA
jgi:hypothetical protein